MFFNTMSTHLLPHQCWLVSALQPLSLDFHPLSFGQEVPSPKDRFNPLGRGIYDLDDITRRVKIDVPSFDGSLDPSIFIDLRWHVMHRVSGSGVS